MEGRPTELTGRAASLAEGSGVRVRFATFDDVDALGPIEVAAGERFRSVGMDAIAEDEPLAPEVLAVAAADGRLWVADLEGRVGGYALAVDLDGQAHLEQVSVHPDASGRGVGAALVAEVVAWADRRSSDLTLSTFRDVRWNAPWYERLGFVVLGEDELDERLRAVRAHEVELGLDVSARVLMRRPR